MSVQHSAIAGADCHANKQHVIVIPVADLTVNSTRYVAFPALYTLLNELYVTTSGVLTTTPGSVSVSDGANILRQLVVITVPTTAGQIFSATGLSITLTGTNRIRVDVVGGEAGATKDGVITVVLGRP